MSEVAPVARLLDRQRDLVRTAGSGWHEPMLATLTERRFTEPGWIYERKLDGVRAITTCEDGAVTVWSRNRKAMNSTYPELVAALSEWGVEHYVVDGEIVAFDGKQTSFARLQDRINLTDERRIARTGVQVFYYVFDLLVLDGNDVRGLGLRDRKRLLRAAVTFTDPVRYSAHRNRDGEAYYAEACRRGWEGLIAKRADSVYRGGRTRDWLKFKCTSGQEFVVGGFTEPRGSRVGLGALLVGYYDGKQLRYAGKVGTGFNEAMLRDLRRRLDGLERDSSPFDGHVDESRPRWVRPELIAEIGFTEWTDAGRLRHPRFVGLRQDKAPTEVVREGPKARGSANR